MNSYFSKRRPIALRLLLLVACSLLANNCFAAKLITYGSGDQAVDACRLSVGQDHIRMFWRDQEGATFGGFQQLNAWLAKRGETLVCATNAGIFGTDLRPIGLYIEDGRILRKLNVRKQAYGNFYLQPNGAFILSTTQAAIVDTDDISASHGALLATVQYATQSGPILLRNSEVNPLFKPDSTNRTIRNAVCTLSEHEIALVRSQQPISFYDFAQQLRDKVGCRDALYLDGTISQLFPYDNDNLESNYGAMIGATKSIAH